MVKIIIGILIFILSLDIPVYSSAAVIVDRFTARTDHYGTPSGWKHLTFPRIKRHTKYTVRKEDENYFLMAVSNRSASAIYKEMNVDTSAYHLLTWRWKISNILEKGDAARKDGDDYAARIYITFKPDKKMETIFETAERKVVRLLYGVDPPGRALNYIWANKVPMGRVLPNAYTKKSVMIAIESGSSEVGHWVTETVDIYEDYKRIFGYEPPPVNSIAIMTDTDDTGEYTSAFYDDIFFKK